MRTLVPILVLAVSLSAPALAAEARGSAVQPRAAAPYSGSPQVGTPYDDIDATGSVGPTDPILIPDYDGPEIDVDRPRRDETERALREFIPE
ncbi:hypothetical protein [Methylobacterium nodulans]|uniref:Uncharacterized protein n=1 Tax=Methylobacterium nodulans (strain LMG 21967 / CNCM I-2342 / ORS 2060) TaxID=460265 RepID=B8IB39_METNO|nr:hypothetical protein [Methylobacterium nodulans]ACL55432.1 conserved hypothetical protein [Methylobacterium nodulans ORS 2060]